MPGSEPLQAGFVNDLQAVYLSVSAPPASSRFLDDLAAVFAAAIPQNASAAEVPDAELIRLATRLDRWRADQHAELARLLADLPDDDPLRCSISLFAPMDYGRLETAQTRALAWLLDPTREHGFGAALLEALLAQQLPAPTPLTIRVDRVESEFPTGNSDGEQGRIDVLATGSRLRDGQRSSWLLVIEAKIDASEGERQLARYDDWITAWAADREVVRIFLTPEGYAPATSAAWQPLSFPELAGVFRTVYGSVRDRPGFHFLQFYLAGLFRDICRWPLPITVSAPDPYAILDYLKKVPSLRKEGDVHGDAR